MSQYREITETLRLCLSPRPGHKSLWDGCDAGLFFALNNELRTGSAENVFGEYSIDVSAIVAVRNIEPGRVFSGAFLAGR